MGLDSYNPTVTARLRNASKTRVLNLTESVLRSVPQEIETLTNLRNLNLSINYLVEIPLFLGRLIQLKHLNLSRNQLEFLPEEIGNLKNLEVLIVSQNKITDLPKSLEKCEGLKTLEGIENKFSIFPPSVCSIPALESLDLSCNRIETFPDAIQNLKAITLNMRNNRMNSLNIENLKLCCRLRVLNVDNNQLSREEIEQCVLNIPPNIKMSYEQNVSLVHTSDLQEMGNESSHPIGNSARKIIGKSGPSSSTVHKHIEMASKSRVLQLKGTGLKKIPEEVAQLADLLRNLELSENKIRDVPAFIGNFSQLKMLHLSNNSIEVLPDEIGNLKKLEVLNLNGNRISKLPDTIAGCIELRTVDISANAFCEFPKELLANFQLDILNISGNKIECLPDEISQLNVIELSLNQNRLNSLNASNVAKCSRLRTLRIEDNCLVKTEFSRELLQDSNVNLIAFQGNLIQEKDFQDLDGYESYQERLTATKRKI